LALYASDKLGQNLRIIWFATVEQVELDKGTFAACDKFVSGTTKEERLFSNQLGSLRIHVSARFISSRIRFMRVSISRFMAATSVCAVTMFTGCHTSNWATPSWMPWGNTAKETASADDLPAAPSISVQPTPTTTASNRTPSNSGSDTRSGYEVANARADATYGARDGYGGRPSPATRTATGTNGYGQSTYGATNPSASSPSTSNAGSQTYPGYQTPSGSSGQGYTPSQGYSPSQGYPQSNPAGRSYPTTTLPSNAGATGASAGAYQGGSATNGYDSTQSSAPTNYPSYPTTTPSNTPSYPTTQQLPESGTTYGGYSNTTRNDNSPASQELLGGRKSAGNSYATTSAIGDAPRGATGLPGNSLAPPASLSSSAGGYSPGSTNQGNVSPASHTMAAQPSTSPSSPTKPPTQPPSGGSFEPSGGSFGGYQAQGPGYGSTTR